MRSFGNFQHPLAPIKLIRNSHLSINENVAILRSTLDKSASAACHVMESQNVNAEILITKPFSGQRCGVVRTFPVSRNKWSTGAPVIIDIHHRAAALDNEADVSTQLLIKSSASLLYTGFDFFVL